MMESPKLNAIKKELLQTPKEVLISYCLRMAKHKIENKELLHYLIFEQGDNTEYKSQIKEMLKSAFEELPFSEYQAAKTLRKTLRLMNKHIKFMGDKVDEAETVAYFCELFMRTKFVKSRQASLINLLFRNLLRIQKIIPKLEEDLQFDLQKEFDALIEELTLARPGFHQHDLR